MRQKTIYPDFSNWKENAIRTKYGEYSVFCEHRNRRDWSVLPAELVTLSAEIGHPFRRSCTLTTVNLNSYHVIDEGMQKNGQTLAIVPYMKKDFCSHRVSQDAYGGTDGMEVCSLKLCQIIAKLYNWDSDCSYRVPGYVLSDHSAAIFNLTQAEVIDKPFYNLR